MNKPHAHIYSAKINKWIEGTLKLPTYLWPRSPHGAKQFRSLGRSNPGCRIVGSSTREEFTTRADFHSSHHWEMMFVGCRGACVMVLVKIFKYSNGIMTDKMAMILTLIATSLRPRQMSTLRFGSTLSVLWYSTTARSAFCHNNQQCRHRVKLPSCLTKLWFYVPLDTK